MARFLTTLFTPFEEVPSLTAVSHRCDRCLRVVSTFVNSLAVTDTFVAMTLNFEALLRLGVRRKKRHIAGFPYALLPWALFPSKVLESRLRACPACVSTRCSPSVSTVRPTASLLPFAHRWLSAGVPKTTALSAIAPPPTDRLAQFLERSVSTTSLRRIRFNTSKLAKNRPAGSLSGGVRSHRLSLYPDRSQFTDPLDADLLGVLYVKEHVRPCFRRNAEAPFRLPNQSSGCR